MSSRQEINDMVMRGKQLTLIILTLSFMVLIVMTAIGIVYPIFPKYLQELGGGPRELGYLAAIYSLMTFLFAPLIGKLADKYGKKKVLVFSLIGFGLSNIMYAEASSLLTLYFSRGLEGIASAGVFPITLALISEFTSEDKRAYYVGIVNSFSAAGIILGPFFGGVFFEHYGAKAPFYLSALFSFLSMIIILIYLPATGKDANREDSQLNTPQQSISQNENKPTIQFLDKEEQLFLKQYVLLLILSFMIFYTWIMIEPGLSFYIYDVLLFSPTQFGLFVSMYGAVLMVFQPFGGKLSMKITPRATIFIGAIITAISYLLLLNKPSFYQLLFMSFIAGLGNALVSPVVGAEVTKCVPQSKKGYWLGVYSSIVSIAGFVGPITGGFIYVAIGPNKTFFLSFLLSLVVGLLFGFFYTSLSSSEDQKERQYQKYDE